MSLRSQGKTDRLSGGVYHAAFEKGAGAIKARLQLAGGEWKFAGFQVTSPEFLKDLSTASCPKRGQPHAAGAKFCPSCGTELSKPTGGEVPADATEADSMEAKE